MTDTPMAWFEKITRSAHMFTEQEIELDVNKHPFEVSNIHDSLPMQVRKLFDNAHYSQATFEAYKFLDKTIARLAKVNKSGYQLMMAAFSETSPLLKLNDLKSESEKDEQKGYQFIFAGTIMAIRNPRGHEHSIKESADECLDHLSIASHLMRRLEKSGFSIV